MSAQLKNLLCRVHQKSHCHLVGSATCGIYLAILALGLKDKKVAIPNSVCPNVPIAILLSGNTPLYLDISRKNLGIDIHELKLNAGRIDAVIAVHAYGSVCDIVDISNFCKLQGIPLIEDIAVAQGAKVESQSVGVYSDIAVLSFGAGKIIDVGHGGAILTDDLSLMERAIRHEEFFGDYLPSSKVAVNNFGVYHTKLYNDHYGPKINSYSSSFKKMALELRDHILYKFDHSYSAAIEERLQRLQSILDSRRIKAETFESLLSPSTSKIEFFTPPLGSVYWRFNIFLENRDNILKLLLSKKFKVSSWFPSADLFFEDRTFSSVKTSVSDNVGDRILNLWINEEVDIDYIQAITKELIRNI